jgi:diaminohydroxyphosphoribosylaminopyrimidine deaminase / 5-amino-6-(5-phosphoribosylamino)uracil reductase
MTDSLTREIYMRRCMDLALSGLGQTAPNPMVGSVIVYNNRIIGEGFHHKCGEPHAEVNAVNSVPDKSLLPHSTLYVNLEPCSHTGKTPPCADMIIRMGIPEVVIGTQDPNPLVSGNGIEKLKQAGIKVVSGVLEKECLELNRRFITFHTAHRPYIILKWAQTRDGFIDVIREDTGNPQVNWISNEISRMLVHKWRSEEQSILIGTKTALMDNPQLNVRHWPGKSPVRLVIDKKLVLPKSLHLFDETSTTYIFNEIKEDSGNNTHYVKMNSDGSFLDGILQFLYKKDIQSVLVEGGRTLLESFIRESLWDEARVFTGDKYFGAGMPAPDINDLEPEIYAIREDILKWFYHETG